MKEKSATFCFLKLKAKENAIFSKIIEGRWLFCRKFRSVLSKFIHLLRTQLLVEAIAMEWWKRKTRNYNQKLNVRVASRITEKFRALNT